MISPKLSPSTKVIVSTRFSDIPGTTFGVAISNPFRVEIAPPTTVNMEASLLKSNSRGTCNPYSFKIEVWSNGSFAPFASANSETAELGHEKGQGTSRPGVLYGGSGVP
jgi:hypothetical protein